MSFGLRASRAKERRRRRRKLYGWLFVILVVLGMGGYSWYAGRQLARGDIKRLETEVATLTSQNTALKSALSKAQAEAAAAENTAADWQQRYKTDVPSGDGKDIYQNVQALLGDGVSADHIRLLLESARNAQQCSPDRESKRFAVASPLSKDPITPVNFDGNNFVLTAEGEPATLEGGAPAGWFDTAKPVTVHFTEPGGKTTDVTSVLPIQKSFARGDTEYRFAITYDDIRGYVRATLERCSL